MTLTATPLRTSIPTCQPGIGTLILSPTAEGLIDGIRIDDVKVWPDDRGYFLEVLRLSGAPPSGESQVSVAINFPGTIKAFHYHVHQTDIWVVAQGLLQVALVDLRDDSPTFGRKNTLYVGALRPWRITIPPGVGHGYKVCGTECSTLVYVTDAFYNKADEGRIPYNHNAIQYDWETQHK